MRLQGPDGKPLWLAYGMNVHPGGTADAFAGAIRTTVVPLRDRLGVEGPFGLAVRFNAKTVDTLRRDKAALERIAEQLETHDLLAFTGNAFVMGDFSGRPLKDDVYRPPWSDIGRLQYTLEFATLMASFSRTEVDVSLSTAPGSWRGWNEGPGAEAARAREIAACAEGLRHVHEEWGTYVRLGLEPEPRCTIETTDELIRFFNGPLQDALDARDPEARMYLGACFDVCHQSVMHEDVPAALDALAAADVPIVKLQASAALEVPNPEDDDALAALEAFDEPVYLHQVAAPDAEGRIHVAEDLGEVLAGDPAAWRARRPWRVHYHVPVFRPETVPPLTTTQPDLVAALRHVVRTGATRHIEIETYTFDVLPEAERAAGSGFDLVDSLAKEYAFVLSVLEEEGVTRAP
ncbi:MAG: metabolite traffic protein EboE [Planctomycetota bacterium]|nr:metabolite traffic protein EboE [Planctomycetota bacterium]